MMNGNVLGSGVFFWFEITLVIFEVVMHTTVIANHLSWSFSLLESA